MGTIGYVVFGIFLLIMVITGVIAAKGQKNSADFWVGGRSFGVVVLALGITASIMHGGTMLSGVGYTAYRGPITLNNLSFSIGFFIVLVYLARKLRKFGGFTIPDFLAERFESNTVRLVSSAIIIVASVLTLIAQTKTMGIIVGEILGIHMNVAIVLGGLIFITYTVMGGLKGVVWTNIFQYIFMMIGAIILGVAVYKSYGGFSDVMVAAEASAPGWSSPTGFWAGPSAVMSWYFVWVVAYFTRIEMVSKVYAAKNERVAAWSLPVSLLFLLIFINFVIYFAGAARVAIWDMGLPPDKILTTLISVMLSPLWGSLALAGLAAAAMSTTDSLLLMSGAAIAHDFLRKGINEKNGVEKSEEYYMKVSKITIGVVGAISIVGAMFTPGIVIVIVSYAVALTGASFALPMLLGCSWKRVSTKAALISMIGGFSGSAIWAVFVEKGVTWAVNIHPIIPGFAISLVCILVITFLTKQVSEKTLEKFFPKEEERFLRKEV